MVMLESYIELNDVRFHAFHGVLPQEREVGNDYLLSIRIGYDVIRAMESDQVKDTINYAAVYEIAKREMEVPSKLLEHVASRIAEALQSKFKGLESLVIRITKLNPPIGADCHGATVELKYKAMGFCD